MLVSAQRYDYLIRKKECNIVSDQGKLQYTNIRAISNVRTQKATSPKYDRIEMPIKSIDI